MPSSLPFPRAFRCLLNQVHSPVSKQHDSLCKNKAIRSSKQSTCILPRAYESARNLAEISLCSSGYCNKTVIHSYGSPQCYTNTSKSPTRAESNPFLLFSLINGQAYETSCRIKLHLCPNCIPRTAAELCKVQAICTEGFLQASKGSPHSRATLKHPSFGKVRD